MAQNRVYDQKANYEIRVSGKLDQTWSEWFGGFRITSEGNETVLLGWVIDQAALHGLLTKLNDLGLTILDVHRIKS